jgi:hypothetical protein
VGIVLNGVILNGLIALRGNVWFALACGLVLRKARKCGTEQKSCKNKLGGPGVKPHGYFLLRSSCFACAKAAMLRG